MNKLIKIYLLPSEAKVLQTFCRKIGTTLYWHFAEVEGFDAEARVVDMLFDIMNTIADAREKENAKTIEEKKF